MWKVRTDLPFGATILVIAPDMAFRRSLAFLLEAEGCRVFLLDSLSSLSAKAGGLTSAMHEAVDCIVIDDAALSKGSAALEELRQLCWPAVVLVDRIEAMAGAKEVGLVEKPMLGGALVEAIRIALPSGFSTH